MNSVPPKPLLEVLDLGRMAYQAALDLQMARVEELKRDAAASPNAPEKAYLLLVEHDPPVITLGRGADENNVILSPEELKSQGFQIHAVSRGGDVTYHGPGQLVGYPILRVDRHGRDVHRYLRDIEEVVIRLLARFGVEGSRKPGLTGAWVGEEKIAATGVALSRWVSYHGFSLNVCPNLAHFGTIVPCGISDKGVTSLSVVLGRRIEVEEVKAPLVETLAEVFGFEVISERD
ncbi:MAG TPA: lipoyl(octanoyl) transferase LipB [Candidatus Sumerlaeota bacterium]|nr:lipoyl(octanoyl) transferase LipB [Candidatus Sumerlaeota bacterium]